MKPLNFEHISPFVHYQTFEGKQAKVTDRRDAEATMETVHAAVRAWKEKQQSDEKSLPI